MTINKSPRVLLFCISAIIIFSALASYVQSSAGKVRVTEITIPTQDGQWLKADLYKPFTATSENPAPMVVVIPGFQRSKETLSNLSIELSRRGIVVISIDPYAQGGSSSSFSTRAATTEGYGMFAVVDYAYETNNLNYIDKTRIGATGHSAGGLAAIRGATYFGKEAKKNGTVSKLHSVFVSGFIYRGFTKKDLQPVSSNIGISYALYDEGAYRNKLKHGDLRLAPEALQIINSSINDKKNHINEITIGKYYGNSTEKNLRVVYNEKVLHPFQPYNREVMANQLMYFEQVFDLKNTLSNDNQIWYWKEICTSISFIVSLIMLIPLTQLMLNIPFFERIKKPIPNILPKPEGKGKILFWILFAISALVAAYTLIPMSELSKTLFVEASSRKQTWFFPQRMNNAIMLWAILNGVVSLIIFYTSYRLFGKKNGVLFDMLGLRIKRSELLRTFLLAIMIFAIYYILLFTIYFLFHVDYRIFFIGIRIFRPVMLLLLVLYAPLFFIFFLSNSLRINGAMRFSNDLQWKTLFFHGLATSIGLLLIICIQYVTFFKTGTVFWTDGWLYVNLLFGVVPMIFFLPFFHNYFFQMTGTVYLGPMITCLVFIMSLLSNTVCYIPI